MANLPFERTILIAKEKLLVADVNRAASTAHRTLMDVIDRLTMVRSSQIDPSGVVTPAGAIGDGFRVVPSSPAAMAVLVRAGLALYPSGGDVPTDIDGVSGLDDRARVKPIVLSADQSVSIDPDPGAGFARKDIIEIKIARRRTDSESRKVLDEISGAFSAQSLMKTLSFSIDGQTGRVAPGGGNSVVALSYKVGTPFADAGTINTAAWGAISPPSTSPGYMKLCEILVPGGTTDIPDGRYVIDFRPIIFGLHGAGRVSGHILRYVGAGAEDVVISQLIAHPGIQVVAGVPGLLGASPQTQTDVYLFAGGGSSGTGPTFSVPLAGWVNAQRLAASPIQSVQVGGYAVGTVSNVLQTTLMGTGIYPSPFYAAVGQPYLYFGLMATQVANRGAVSFPTTDPIGYAFSIDVQS